MCCGVNVASKPSVCCVLWAVRPCALAMCIDSLFWQRANGFHHSPTKQCAHKDFPLVDSLWTREADKFTYCACLLHKGFLYHTGSMLTVESWCFGFQPSG